MKILVSGSTGLVGAAVTKELIQNGDQVFQLVRDKALVEAHRLFWVPEINFQNPSQLEGMEAVVHLAGESIAEGRWTGAKKARIRDSRIIATRKLCESLSSLKNPPSVFISASAIGFYGHRGDEMLTETSSPGKDFLAMVCQEWEKAAEPLAQIGVRVIQLRFGIILSPRGGALAKMLLPFKMGLGGKIGNGHQFMSWIGLDDVVRIILTALKKSDLKGPINVVAPNPVTNLEFTKALGTVLRRPTLFPMPAFAARLAFGEMADALLLSSARVIPTKLQQASYPFKHTELELCLKEMLTAPL